MRSIFALPVSSQVQHTGSSRSSLLRKRKRRSPDSTRKSQAVTSPAERNLEASSKPVEYSAVLTPVERAQRRLAGHPLDQEPPAPPFPHAAPRSVTRPRAGAEPGQNASRGLQTLRSNAWSLHKQHLAVMTALLHKYILSGDYERAKRALGLIVRTHHGGQAIDIRTRGLWGVGAEILSQPCLPEDLRGHRIAFSREAFEVVRSYYEALAIQYPQHKTWPDKINALDFSIALFGTWIHVIDMEGQWLLADLAEEDGPRDVSIERQVRSWMLDQALQIGHAMDARMSDAMFRDEVELMRLRGMVGLWIADLSDMCSDLEGSVQNDGIHGDPADDDEIAGLFHNVERIQIQSSRAQETERYRQHAQQSRELAREILEKVGFVVATVEEFEDP